MPADRFFIDAPLEGTLVLEGAELHHLIHVMRLDQGDTIELVNGRGDLAEARIDLISKKGAHLHILSSRHTPLAKTLYLAIPIMRASKLELVIEKCTELGAHAFWIYLADHSEVKELSKSKLERLMTIAISALKQSGRLYLPSIEVFKSLQELLQQEAPPLFFGSLEGNQGFPKEKESILFASGPEKGFSQKERSLLEKKGEGILINPNILRAETAPIAITAIYQFSPL